MIIETERLYLRKLMQSDFDALCGILQDNETMYAYEGAFSDEEVQEWLDRQLARYEKYGFGLWAVILKENGELIGQCGLTMQPWKNKEVLEIGYLFNRAYWHRGYATEAAVACKKYAFEVLGAEEVCSIIRDTNTASQNVALRNGMAVYDSFVKHYRGVDMPHYRYIARRNGGIGMNGFTVKYNELTAEQFTLLWESVWGDAPDIAQVRLAMEHTLFRVSVWDGEKIIGMARMLGDMGLDYYIKDVVVIPEYQHRGIGRLMINELMKFVNDNGIGGTDIFVELCAVPDKMPFYEKLGFSANEAQRLKLMHRVK